MMKRWTSVFTCMLALSLSVGIAAARPAFSVTSRAFVGRVEIDTKLRPYAKLRAFLLKPGLRPLFAGGRPAADANRQ